MLRAPILAASRSPRLRRFVDRAPATRAVVRRFVAGERTDQVLAVARALAAAGLEISIDHLGEDTTDAALAEAAADAYVELLGELSAAGLTPAAEVSVKMSALGQALDPAAALGRARRVCAAARSAGTTVTVDAEDHTTVDGSLAAVRALRADFPTTGAVVQAYLRRTEADCRSLAGAGSRVRLCKGAYAAPPVGAYTGRDVDLSYARCLAVLMEGDGYPMVATHDPALIDLAGRLAAGLRRGPADLEYQLLYGVRPGEQRRLAAAGARVRVYVPYGGEWYGYLMRRLAERPQNLAFFLRALGSRS